MELRELFDKAIKVGMENDPRGKALVLKDLEATKKDYEGLKEKEKEYFDTEALTNPYDDSRILFGDDNSDIKSAMVGIDLEVGEILLADTLRRNGTSCDLLIAHHPEGRAYASLWSVMKMQADIFGRFGVPISTAESLMEKRISDVERKLLPVNHTRSVDAARLLGIPMMNLHTPSDNMVASYLQKLFDEKQPYTLDDIIDILMEIPEYQQARKNGAGPKIFTGSKKRKAGKVFVDMTGGTSGSKDIFQTLALGGVNTLVGMHASEEHRKEAENHHLNMVIAGHISSDNLGMNLLLDAAVGNNIDVLECSGFKRFARV